MSRLRSTKGSAGLEFVMAGIPLIFMAISIVEVSRGMWMYDTLAHAVETTTRDLAVRGKTCSTYVSGCAQTIGGYAQLFNRWAIGLDPSQVNVTFASLTQTVGCAPLNSCYTNNTAWPPNGDNDVNLDIWVSATMPFNSAISMFFFGSAPVAFGRFNLSASSHQQILF